MVNILQLPGYNPGQGINFQPVQNALAQVSESAQFDRQNALQQRQLGLQREQVGMQRERLGMEREQHGAQQRTAAIQRFAGHAQKIDALADPVQRKAAWDRLIASHPDAAKLDPIYRDPMNGPKLVMQEAEGFMGQKEQAAIGLTRAQTAQAYAQAERAKRENIETGLVPQYMVGEDGVVRPFVMNKRGEPVPVQLPQGMRALGPGGTAEARREGQAVGQARVDLPKVQQNAATTLKYIDDVLNDPNLPSVTGAEGYLPTVRSTSRDTEARISQLGGRAFLSAFESLKGGGQITEIEGKKATDALARLTDLKQSDAGYKKALEDFRNEVMDLVRIAEQRARVSPSAPRQSAPPAAAPPAAGGWSIRRVD